MEFTITPAMWLAILSLARSGITLIGSYTEEQLVQMAIEQEERLAALQQRQEEG